MTQQAPIDDATRAQIGAADPSGSVWLAANAGSGKTRVLTNRVAWLLLEGTPPENILCLTYTKAAAGEMQNRLFDQLGKWTMMADVDLRADLATLGVKPGRVASEQLERARTLFARAIETPGGLKIQTIHAFCASLLRRFPLEAGVPPDFREMDDVAKARLLSDVLDEMAVGPDAALVDGIARYLTDMDPTQFLQSVVASWPDDSQALPPEDLRRALGMGPESAQDIRASVTGSKMLDQIGTFADAAAPAPGKTLANIREKLAQVPLADAEDRLPLLRDVFLTQEDEPRKTTRWPKEVKDGAHGPLVETFDDLAEQVRDAVARLHAFGSLHRAQALHAFAPVFTRAVATRKAERALLDFDDQIQRARRLLTRADMAQWVLFKLDGGVDHILVDEAQDTSPAQWDVIEALVAEFAAGQGARPDVNRTLFVVGDLKQSIYSFQGADPRAFSRMRDRFRALLSPPGLTDLRDHQMRHSFRSSPVILALVDRVFNQGGGVGDAPQHLAFKSDMPGRVDLWTPIETEKPDHSDRKWFDPVDRPAANDAGLRLAENIAQAVHDMLHDGTMIPQKDGRRPLRPDDILILFQRRSDLFHQTIRACKSKGLDLAGADRLKLLEDMAVKDLLAVLRFIAVPEDDLTLATVLRSPLADTDEDGLFRLAHDRGEARLWSVLRNADSDPVAVEMLADVLKVADVLRPYELLQRVLIKHDGRRRLTGRLGPESAEAIEALLDQALIYEQTETPSLQGFLGWLDAAEVEVKREGGKGSIRVMTVHGSKGLEAPVVILPDTAKRPVKSLTGVQVMPDGTAIWMPTKAEYAPALIDLNEAATEAQQAERDRLLYVALTRAESWLIICAAGPVGEAPEESWYARVKAAVEGHGTAISDGVTRIEFGDWSTGGVGEDGSDVPDPNVPDWLETVVAAPSVGVKPIAPSALPGAKTLPGDQGDGAPEAMARGTAIHALLEHLPTLPRDDWDRVATAILSGLGLSDTSVLTEARAVLDAPHLADVFGDASLSEVPFVLPHQEGTPAISGTFDRVLVTENRVRIIDFKSNQ
ncbi:MAG: double-strand break repair helicase AddA, partial [Pseudomonadota bacterium]